jgi:microcystin-dependent protein
MGNQFLSELRLMSFNFAPRGWAMCNGQTMSIQQNAALFALIGTYYGGNGVTTFQLPNLVGRTPISMSADGSYVIGQLGGEVNHTLVLNEMPSHTHLVNAASTATGDTPPNNFLAGGGAAVFNVAANMQPMNSAMIGNSGGSQPHNNMQPYLVMTWCIALQGIFPSRS